MAKVRKIPYHTMERSLFSKKVWKVHDGSQGCVPLNTPQTVSLDRLAPGEPAPPPKPKPPKPTPEQLQAQKAEEARQKLLAQQQKKQAQAQPKEKAKEPEFVDAEECENVKLPVFDLQDIPITMDKIAWPVSAKFARKWFASPKHIYNDDANSVQPLDDTTITLDWALKFGNVKKRLNELLSEGIYSEKAVAEAKEKIINRLKKIFVGKGQATHLSFNTTAKLNDLRQFHIDWHFQHANISSRDTLDGLHMTDLTASVANCNLYAAIGNVEVSKEQYFKYDNHNGTKTYCIDATATITHVYVYIKDNYSFNDKSSSSQYLGHWNKKGIIIAWSSVISEITNTKHFNTELGNNEKMDFYGRIQGKDKPVDLRKGMFRKYKRAHVYFPIHNRDYNQWRDKHNRGGDFMIYSKPKYMKLKKPIKFSLETLCRPPEKM